LRQLVVQKVGSVGARGLDHPQVGQHGVAVQGKGKVHGLDYHRRQMFFRRFLLALLVALALLAAAAVWWVYQPLRLSTPVLDLSIELGTSPRAVAQAVVEAGADTQASLLYGWFRLSGRARQIKAGSYEIVAGDSPYSLLAKLTRGEEVLRVLVLVEGWNFRQVRDALAQADLLRNDTQSLTDAAIMAQLGRSGTAAEGRFYPDTYAYAKGSSDLALLRRALHAMDRKLDTVWRQRASNLALQTPDQALILASLIEKETGRPADRSMISSVFHNRLAQGMLLQTDPTVIYGLGAQFDGRLKKRDLQTDTPWNTYTRAGLPPTPIALPGKAALLAAVLPARSRALYFVARGDGSSEFSDSLEAHNRAVNKFIRHRTPPAAP
jgi:UPF0755 protein